MSFPLSRTYSISEVAELLSVGRRTVFKWLFLDALEEAINPPEEWFKLPEGQIRIRERIVPKLMKVRGISVSFDNEKLTGTQLFRASG